jgi:uncharacterized protein YbjT (DUF2867 family)
VITIIGGTGTIGTALVRGLIGDGHTVRVMARTPEKARQAFGDEVEVVGGDLDDVTSVREALEGAERLFLLVPPGPELPARELGAIEEAADAGVRHIVNISALGAGPDVSTQLGRWHWQTEEAIRASGSDFTILRPGSFMQNYISHAQTIQRDGAFYDTHTDAPMALIDARDIADVAKVALTDDGHAGQVYALTGGEAITNAEIADILSNVLRKPVHAVEVAKEQAREGMAAAGLPDWLIDDLLVLADMQKAGHAAKVSPSVRDVTGREPRTFEEFARDYRIAFGVEVDRRPLSGQA